jgi:hypothetical protein
MLYSDIVGCCRSDVSADGNESGWLEHFGPPPAAIIEHAREEGRVFGYEDPFSARVRAALGLDVVEREETLSVKWNDY